MAFALIISAGLDGIEEGAVLHAPVDEDLYTADESIRKTCFLAEDLETALEMAEKSDFVKCIVGQELLSNIMQ